MLDAALPIAIVLDCIHVPHDLLVLRVSMQRGIRWRSCQQERRCIITYPCGFHFQGACQAAYGSGRFSAGAFIGDTGPMLPPAGAPFGCNGAL